MEFDPAEGVPEPTVLRKRYHQLSLKYHPDKNGPDASNEQMQKINEAYKALVIASSSKAKTSDSDINEGASLKLSTPLVLIQAINLNEVDLEIRKGWLEALLAYKNFEEKANLMWALSSLSVVDTWWPICLAFTVIFAMMSGCVYFDIWILILSSLFILYKLLFAALFLFCSVSYLNENFKGWFDRLDLILNCILAFKDITITQAPDHFENNAKYLFFSIYMGDVRSCDFKDLIKTLERAALFKRFYGNGLEENLELFNDTISKLKSSIVEDDIENVDDSWFGCFGSCGFGV